MSGFSQFQNLEAARLYARPLGLGFKKNGLAFPLAGGPVSFNGLEIIIADDKTRLFENAFPLTSLEKLKRDLPKPLKTRLERLLSNLTSPRQPIAGLSFDKPLLMGILNLTPDSFSDGGDHLEKPLSRARAMFEAGADIVDIGAESTRPGAKPVPLKEELARLSPVFKELGNLPGPVSIDTRKAPVMEKALTAGAKIINDVSALGFDNKSVDVAQGAKGVVLMHARGGPEEMQKNPKYRDVLLEVYDFLEDHLAFARRAGIAAPRLIVDPGIGFGKTLEHNLELIRNLSLFQGLGVAVLAGLSRKRFIGDITGIKEPKDRLSGSLAASLFALSQGVQIVRCHDVRDMRAALDVYQTITSFG